MGLTNQAAAVIAKVSSETFNHRLKLEHETDIERAKKSKNRGWQQNLGSNLSKQGL